jgi:hypothetical protein
LVLDGISEYAKRFSNASTRESTMAINEEVVQR